MAAMKIGIIGAGVISEQYLENFSKAKAVSVEMIADLDISRSEQRATQYGITSFGTPEELLARDDIELIVNLTIPKAHEQVTVAALKAGKHVWSEKPLALDKQAAERIRKQAKESGREVGCAPDTFLGPGIQTGLRLIREGRIGKVTGATTAFEVSGPESWHPNPDFLYAKGGGPIFDMGPYYLTALVCALGPVSQVVARSSQARDYRVIGSGPRQGEKFPVEVPTNVLALIDFVGGEAAQSSFSFDTARPRAGILEIHGTEGSIVIPDPNMHEGSLQLFRIDSGSWEPEEIACVGKVMQRGVGVIDMIHAIAQGKRPRADIELAAHVVEVMQALEQAATSGELVKIESTAKSPELVDVDFNPWISVG
jgi:predicted dehydrogenase